jgi:predicted nucleic acid-binding protein
MEIAKGLHGERSTETAEQRFVVLASEMHVIAFGLKEAIVAAGIRHSLREQGRSVRSRGLDLLIAATAITHDLTLLTNNPSDYHDVPRLRLEVANLHV